MAVNSERPGETNSSRSGSTPDLMKAFFKAFIYETTPISLRKVVRLFQIPKNKLSDIEVKLKTKS